MSSALLRLAEQVLPEFPIAYSSLSLFHAAEAKAIWKIAGRNRMYGLKRLMYGKDQMLFAIQAQKYLKDRSGPVPALILTRTNQLYAERNDEIFILYDWVAGRKPIFANAADLRQAVRVLAGFHKASVGFRPALACRESTKLGKWPGQYATMEEQIRGWRTDAGFPALSTALKPYWDSMIRLAGQARRELKNSPYEELVAGGTRMLGHQDYSEGNLLLHGTSGTVLDLDSVTYDFPARDLRKLILKRMLVRGRWESALYRKIIAWYCHVYPLGADQLRLLHIDLSFPHLFHMTAKNPFRNRSPVSASRLLAAVRIEQEKASALSNQ